MESRFAHLRQRDTSVSMLRVKMSRRKSQSLKENRQQAVNARRQLDKVLELDVSSLEASLAVANLSTIKENTQKNETCAKSKALEERLKQLERWKERKALEKEKEKREKQRKGVFKTGLYHPKDTISIVSLPVVSSVAKKTKETKVDTAPSQRVTRSMKQQTVQRPLKPQDPNTTAKKAQPAVERSTRTRVIHPAPAPILSKTRVCVVEPVVQGMPTRSANRPTVTAVPVLKDKPQDKAADVRTTRSRAIVNSVAPSSGKERKSKVMNKQVNNTAKPSVPKGSEERVEPSGSEEEDMVVDKAPTDTVPAVDPVREHSSIPSFAPEGFVFQAPAGLSSFKFEPLSLRSAEAFLTPSSSFSLPLAPVFSLDLQAEPSKPSPPKSPRHSPSHTSPTVAPPTSGSPLESEHDVPYFRSEILNETARLNTLCVYWESKVEDESIPEEMRDRMRTAVGQARLLMKERFNQFSGLVDDCELGRGEKITTCTDLQGFWDMVYYQVEDVNKKFEALKEAEGRGWVEEHKPPPRERKAVKKPSAAPAKPMGTKAAAKSRLAAVKAAMKARQQAAEAEKAAVDAVKSEDDPSPNSQDPQPQAGAQVQDTVVFNGGFFQVESPAKPTSSVRRSSRLSAAVASPSSNCLTPRRVTRRSLALMQAVASPARPALTPASPRLSLNEAAKSQQSSQEPKDAVNASLCFSPVKEVHSDEPEGIPTHQTDAVKLVHSIPSVSVVEEQNKPAEAVNVVHPVSPRLTLSPCESPPPVSQAPEPSSLSFTLSPCVSTTHQGHADAQESVCCTPDRSAVEEVPGLDFERYLQPSQRGSLSPWGTPTEALSPMAVDTELESPRGQCDDSLAQQEPAIPAVSSLLTPQTPQIQTAESAMLLFTPDLKDRIRQSVCPSDLMVFTPPSNV